MDLFEGLKRLKVEVSIKNLLPIVLNVNHILGNYTLLHYCRQQPLIGGYNNIVNGHFVLSIV